MAPSLEPFLARPSVAFRQGRFLAEERSVPQETAIAVSVNGTTHAVMMATPTDLSDFAIGLALNEGIILAADDIEQLSIEEVDGGIDCRLWLAPERAAGYVVRRRQMTGPVGCGLCGVDSLALAAPDLPALDLRAAITPQALLRSFDEMHRRQDLSRRTRAVHAAGFALRTGEVRVLREDVGRHNALDKVAGALASTRRDPSTGFLVVTSRVSVELIQKAVRMRCGLLAAISAPTDLAIRTADALGVTLVAVVRGGEFEIFTHADSIVGATEVGDDAA